MGTMDHDDKREECGEEGTCLIPFDKAADLVARAFHIARITVDWIDGKTGKQAHRQIDQVESEITRELLELEKESMTSPQNNLEFIERSIEALQECPLYDLSDEELEDLEIEAAVWGEGEEPGSELCRLSTAAVFGLRVIRIDRARDELNEAVEKN